MTPTKTPDVSFAFRGVVDLTSTAVEINACK